MNYLIAVPCMDMIPTVFTECILNLDKPAHTKAFLRTGSLVYDSRNIMALKAIDMGIDRVLWLDSDMLFTPNTLKQLSDDMDEIGCEMVTGVYVKRFVPYTPVLYKRLDEPGTDENGIPVPHIDTYTDYPVNATFPVDGCGFGCVMTSVSLLKRVYDAFGAPFLPLPWAGEDIAFCYKVKQLGEKIYCDSRIKCGHVGQFVFSPDAFEQKRGDMNNA